MLYASVTPSEKRRQLRAALGSGRLLRVPGAFSPLVARLLEAQGWPAVYVSGAALSADLALPDIGLTTLEEVAVRGQQIARVTALPTLIDADTGFGEPLNAARTIQELEERGLAGCHLEDQVNPKRCGHLDDKAVVPVDTMRARLHAAIAARRDPDFLVVARTDARAVEGIDAAIDRARAYVDAGADAVFPEALQSQEEFAAFRAAIDVPLVANMTEFGKSPLLDAATLARLGYDAVLYPVTGLRLAMGAVQRGFATMAEEGHQRGLLDRMQTRAELYELLDYDAYTRFDGAVRDASRDAD